jgi:hypothetical protein
VSDRLLMMMEQLMWTIVTLNNHTGLSRLTFCTTDLNNQERDVTNFFPIEALALNLHFTDQRK